MKNYWTKHNINDLTGKVAIVTGANSGIGFETARVLSEKNAQVIFACRNDLWGKYAVNKVKLDCGNTNIFYKHLNLADLSSIHKFSENIITEFDSLDILVNNAGIMMCPYQKTIDGFEMQIGVNHFGHFALMGLLLKKIMQTPYSRVVNVSSLYHRPGNINFDDINSNQNYHPVKAYQQSKLANLLFTYELARKFKEENSSTIAVASHPGWTATNLQKYKFIFKMFNPIFAQKPPMGALPTLYGAVAENVENADYFGPRKLEIWGYPKKVNSSKRSKDLNLAKRLWQLSEEMTSISFDFKFNN
tara:strand:- start:3785 stop:4693 length:909 start_codon:yes stop_codon:yes gene_type:complete